MTIVANPSVTLTAAADLEQLAEWMREHHDDLPAFFSIHCYERGAQISFRAQDDAEVDALIALADDDGYRSDHHYDGGDWVRIADGTIAERLTISVAVPR